MPGRLKAIWLLALALIRTVVRRLFGGGRAGIAAFRANYDADRLPPVSPEERAELGTFGRCIACGLCDRGEGERITASAGQYRGVMALMLAASRNMPDFREAALSFRHVPDAVLAEKERICPTRVPMRRIARFVRQKAVELGHSLPPAHDTPALPEATSNSRPKAAAPKADPKAEPNTAAKTAPKTGSGAERL